MADQDNKTPDKATETAGEEVKTPEQESNTTAQDAKAEKETKKSVRNLPTFGSVNPPESTRSPLITLKEIVSDKNIDDEYKQWLLGYSVTRFNNRRKMAYISLWSLIAMIIFVGLAAIVDGTFDTKILIKISSIESFLTWAAGFLASIVAAYYGMSSFRPSS